MHIDNLPAVLQRGGLHSPNASPDDSLVYKTIHNAEIQNVRNQRSVACGPGGVIHDYIPFYFGYLSPMLLQLKTGRVEGYNEGQEPLIYLVTTAQDILSSGVGCIFSDGHGIAAFTKWFDDLAELNNVDWNTVYQRYWTDTTNDMDRQRRKQAEFLIHQFREWPLVKEIAVINLQRKQEVECILNNFPDQSHPQVKVR